MSTQEATNGSEEVQFEAMYGTEVKSPVEAKPALAAAKVG
jgi:hypothetical protein